MSSSIVMTMNEVSQIQTSVPNHCTEAASVMLNNPGLEYYNWKQFEPCNCTTPLTGCTFGNQQHFH
ncbi:MAG: hypothetical protein R2784_02175 [Saprospiraceae bacterium]